MVFRPISSLANNAIADIFDSSIRHQDFPTEYFREKKHILSYSADIMPQVVERVVDIPNPNFTHREGLCQ